MKCEENGIFFSRSGITKRIIVYPSMKCEPEEDGVIAVQDAELKYAKQIAVKKILEELRY